MCINAGLCKVYFLMHKNTYTCISCVCTNIEWHHFLQVQLFLTLIVSDFQNVPIWVLCCTVNNINLLRANTHTVFPFSLSPSFSFFPCFEVISLALWSEPGSGPRISPQRHNYHTGLNVPPTSYSSHQRPYILSPQPSFPLMISVFLSPLLLYLIHTLCLPSLLPFPLPLFFPFTML